MTSLLPLSRIISFSSQSSDSSVSVRQNFIGNNFTYIIFNSLNDGLPITIKHVQTRCALIFWLVWMLHRALFKQNTWQMVPRESFIHVKLMTVHSLGLLKILLSPINPVRIRLIWVIWYDSYRIYQKMYLRYNTYMTIKLKYFSTENIFRWHWDWFEKNWEDWQRIDRAELAISSLWIRPPSSFNRSGMAKNNCEVWRIFIKQKRLWRTTNRTERS